MKTKSILLHSLGALAFWGSLLLILYSCNSSHHTKSSRLNSIETNLSFLSNHIHKTYQLIKEGDQIHFEDHFNTLSLLSNHLNQDLQSWIHHLNTYHPNNP